MSTTQETPVGVIVARFQVPDLHEGHRHLIDTVRSQYPDTLVVLGEHGGLRTDYDPLTFDERKLMVRESYQDLAIDRLRDHPFDHHRWSDWLDQVVESNFPGRRAIMCGGSHDSFLSLYTGKHIKQPIEPLELYSGTQLRRSLVDSPATSVREAIIKEEMRRHPTAYSAADIAIVDDERERVLCITKHWFDGVWTLPGGFLDPEKDENDEATAPREQGEELPGIVTDGTYVRMGSRIRVDDPRYRKSKDKIYTTLFCTNYVSGTSNGGDDAKAARWMSRRDLERFIAPWHQPQVERVIARWDQMKAKAA